jgi:Icc-related predicted phosphoesterase
VPSGDILIHAGDLTSHGKKNQVQDFADWFRSQPHKHKVVIPGNHDWYAEQSARECEALFHGVNYAIHGCIQVAGFKIGMFAFQPRFFGWAFNVDRNSPKMEFLWSRIDNDCDIIVSHGPPQGLCDLTPRGERVGCEVMYKKLKQIEKLKLVVCGHIHEGYGEIDW